MARVKIVDPASTTGRAKELFDGPLKGKHFNMYKALASSGAALDAYVSLSGALKGGMLEPTERELVALLVGQTNGCEYCVSAHTVLGKAAGLSEGQTIDVRRGKADDPKLAALIRFVQALHERRGHVRDSDLADLRAAGYGDGHIAEIVAHYAMNTFSNYFNHVAQPEIDFPAAPKL